MGAEKSLPLGQFAVAAAIGGLDLTGGPRERRSSGRERMAEHSTNMSDGYPITNAGSRLTGGGATGPFRYGLLLFERPHSPRLCNPCVYLSKRAKVVRCTGRTWWRAEGKWTIEWRW